MLIRKDVRTKIRNDYFEWLFRITCENKFAKDISYRKLRRYQLYMYQTPSTNIKVL